MSTTADTLSDRTGKSTGPDPLWRPLDPAFDAAVMAITAKLLPDGYDVSDSAPHTFTDLVEHLDAGGRMVVWSGASGLTIFGSPEVNYAFRAWHDWCHWKGRHPFTMTGEAATCSMQVRHLRQHAPTGPDLTRWEAYLYAEVVGQVLFRNLHGDFPGNQRLFVRQLVDVLINPQANVR